MNATTAIRTLYDSVKKHTAGFTQSRTLGVGLLFVLLAVDPVAAQTTTSAFCDSAMVETIKNIFTVIQLGGPLIGGVIALGSTIALSTIRRVDKKKELKEIRNQGVLYGVIVAPLGTTIITFLLNNIVAGGSSCGF